MTQNVKMTKLNNIYQAQSTCHIIDTLVNYLCPNSSIYLSLTRVDYSVIERLNIRCEKGYYTGDQKGCGIVILGIFVDWWVRMPIIHLLFHRKA